MLKAIKHYFQRVTAHYKGYGAGFAGKSYTENPYNGMHSDIDLSMEWLIGWYAGHYNWMFKK